MSRDDFLLWQHLLGKSDGRLATPDLDGLNVGHARDAGQPLPPALRRTEPMTAPRGHKAHDNGTIVYRVPRLVGLTLAQAEYEWTHRFRTSGWSGGDLSNVEYGTSQSLVLGEWEGFSGEISANVVNAGSERGLGVRGQLVVRRCYGRGLPVWVQGSGRGNAELVVCRQQRQTAPPPPPLSS